MFRSFSYGKHCFQCPVFVSRCRLYLRYTAGNFNKNLSICKTFCQHEQASTHLSFASNSSKGQILRALSNWMGPFYSSSIRSLIRIFLRISRAFLIGVPPENIGPSHARRCYNKTLQLSELQVCQPTSWYGQLEEYLFENQY